MKFDKWLDEWLELYVKPSKKRSTYLRYESALRLHVRPSLGEREITELNGLMLQKTVITLLEGGNAYSGKGLSANTVGQVVRILQSALTQAVRIGLVERQYADEICKPKEDPQRERIKCFTSREQKAIEETALQKKDKRAFGVVITLYVGLRVGELLALTWDDIDLKHGLLTVNKTCRDGWGNGYQKIIGTPKTQSSYRTIPIPSRIMPYFKTLKKESKSEYVISGNGKEISVRSYQRTFSRLLARAKVRQLGFHALRHTFATRAIENNVDIKTLSEVMGHKSPAITLAIYAHSLAPHKRSMMNRLGKLLSGALQYDDEEDE